MTGYLWNSLCSVSASHRPPILLCAGRRSSQMEFTQGTAGSTRFHNGNWWTWHESRDFLVDKPCQTSEKWVSTMSWISKTGLKWPRRVSIRSGNRSRSSLAKNWVIVTVPKKELRTENQWFVAEKRFGVLRWCERRERRVRHRRNCVIRQVLLFGLASITLTFYIQTSLGQRRRDTRMPCPVFGWAFYGIKKLFLFIR